MTVPPRLANATWGPVSLCLVLANTKVLSLSVNVFSTKVIIGDTIFTSPTGDGTAILRGHQSHAKVAKGVPSFLTFGPQNNLMLGLSSFRPPWQQSPFFCLLNFWRTREILCLNPVRSLLSMRGKLLGYSLEPRPERRVRGTAGSVMTVRLSVNGCSHTKSQFDEFKQDSQVQKLVCGEFKGLTPLRQSLLFSSLIKK